MHKDSPVCSCGQKVWSWPDTLLPRRMLMPESCATPASMPCSGTGVGARAARLGLGRVSVVRGEGRLAGTPCIDDTIRSLEPVADHLTRYSGLVRGHPQPDLAAPLRLSVLGAFPMWAVAVLATQVL
jgi:hypothetical protein